MKNLLNKITLLAALALLPLSCFATGEITGVYNASASGTTSATVTVPPSSEFTCITDLGAKLDNGVTSGFVSFRSGDIMYNVTSATSGSGTVAWFSNPSTANAVSVGDYILIYDDSLGVYYLRTVSAATTTSVTVTETITVGLTTSDKVWAVNNVISRPVPAINSLTASTAIYLPRGVPTAVTVDGNTTACRISVSAVRSNYK